MKIEVLKLSGVNQYTVGILYSEILAMEETVDGVEIYTPFKTFHVVNQDVDKLIERWTEYKGTNNGETTTVKNETTEIRGCDRKCGSKEGC